MCVRCVSVVGGGGCGGGEVDGGAQTHRTESGGRSGVGGDNNELIGCCDMVGETKGGEFQLEQPGRCQVPEEVRRRACACASCQFTHPLKPGQLIGKKGEK